MRARHWSGFLFLVAPLSLNAGCQSAQGEPTLDEVRSIAEKFRDVNVAKAEGYTTDNKCVTAEMLGIPAAWARWACIMCAGPARAYRPSLRRRVAGASTAPARTPISASQRCSSTSRSRTAHCNWSRSRIWYSRRPGTRKTRSRQNSMVALIRCSRTIPATTVDEAHGWEPHYEQHLWVFRDNPNGAYSPFNPKVTCKHHKPPGPVPHADVVAVLRSSGKITKELNGRADWRKVAASNGGVGWHHCS